MPVVVITLGDIITALIVAPLFLLVGVLWAADRFDRFRQRRGRRDLQE